MNLGHGLVIVSTLGSYIMAPMFWFTLFFIPASLVFLLLKSKNRVKEALVMNVMALLMQTTLVLFGL